MAIQLRFYPARFSAVDLKRLDKAAQLVGRTSRELGAELHRICREETRRRAGNRTAEVPHEASLASIDVAGWTDGQVVGALRAAAMLMCWGRRHGESTGRFSELVLLATISLISHRMQGLQVDAKAARIEADSEPCEMLAFDDDELAERLGCKFHVGAA